MFHLKKYLHHNREQFGFPAGERILVELAAPERASRLNRCLYVAGIDSDPSRSLIIQADRSLAGHLCRTNPYEPVFHQAVSKFLIENRGSFEINACRYYWASFIQSPSLLDTLRVDPQKGREQLLSVARSVLDLQAVAARPAKDPVASLLALVREKIDDERLSGRFAAEAAAIREMIGRVPHGVSSWSHGDLWPKEIFPTEAGCTIIDWEWSLPEAPLGSDVVDLYLNTAQHVHGLSLAESWGTLLGNGVPELRALHDLLRETLGRLDPDLQSARGILLYTLLRWWGREVAQDGVSALGQRVFIQLAEQVMAGEYAGAWSLKAEQTISGKGGIRTVATTRADSVLFSVIIPTFNRAEYLADAIESIAAQGIPHRYYEIVVVDNGSTDSTREVVGTLAAKTGGDFLRYVHEPVPGLLSGRHRGAREAKGEFLCFVDDDILAGRGWLTAVMNSFNDRNVHLVGGPSLPMFEAEPAPWVAAYCSLIDSHITCCYLSLLDLGETMQMIDPVYIWGLNFSIRKQTLMELGGFHPDNIPKRLQHFQGDGETGLSQKIRERGYTALYHPQAKVTHRIPQNRLTVDGFRQRAYYQGVCDSYGDIRREGGASPLQPRIFDPHDPLIPLQPGFQEIHQAIHRSYVEGYNFHLQAVKRSPTLLAWVLKAEYFDYELPLVAEELGETQ